MAAVIGILIAVVLPGICPAGHGASRPGAADTAGGDKEKRAEFLRHLLETFRSDEPGEEPKEVPVWESWLRRTGELPPDFDRLPADAFPPDLLTFRDGRPVADSGQWAARRKEIRAILDQYMFGNWPPPPETIAIKYQRTVAEENEVYVQQNVQLWFAPSTEAVEFAERTFSYIEVCYREAAKVFELYGKRGNIVLSSPNDFNRYPPEYQEIVNRWLSNMSD